MQNKINTYTCPDGHVTITRDAEEGVTPMMKACPICGEMARSGFYNVDQSLIPTHEWYTPKFPNRYENAGMRQHIEAGGLAFRKIGDPDETELMPEPLSVTTHELKILPDYFLAIVEGNKTFEVRKNNRNFKVGDKLLLQEHTPESGYTDRTCLVDVTYILPGGQFGIDADYCVMSVFPIDVEGFEGGFFPEGPEHEGGFPITTFAG